MATDGSDIVSTVNTSGHDLPGDLPGVVVAAQEHDLPVQHGGGVADPPLPGNEEKNDRSANRSEAQSLCTVL